MDVKRVFTLVNAGVNLKIWGGHYWSRRCWAIYMTIYSPYYRLRWWLCQGALRRQRLLTFLSKLNRDTYAGASKYACGRIVLAERTDDLMQMFKEDEEACFFFLWRACTKVRWLLVNPKREQIAQAGTRRVWTDGHDVNSRAQEFITKLNVKNFWYVRGYLMKKILWRVGKLMCSFHPLPVDTPTEKTRYRVGAIESRLEIEDKSWWWIRETVRYFSNLLWQ